MLKILDNNYYDLIINTVQTPSYDTGDNITYMDRMHSLLHIAIGSNIMNFCDLGRHPYGSFPSLLTLTSTINLEKSGVSSVQSNPYLAFFGNRVLVAVIDTGIDYRHEAFRYSNGTSRILSIWDQTIQSGNIPDTFTYGSEYTQEQINQALNSENPLDLVPTNDTNGHGTAMASIIAGSVNENQGFSGVVPQSSLVVVKLKPAKESLKRIFFAPEKALCYQESDVILGIRYVVTLSEKLNRPIVICLALGTSQGGHDGRGATSNYIDHLSLLPWHAISVSGGNEGNNGRHYFNSTSVPPYYHDFELRVGSNETMFSMEIWPYSPSRLSIDISSPNRESTQLVSSTLDPCRKFSFIFNQTTIYVNNIIFEEETGDQMILLRFENPLPGIWYIRVQNAENEAFSFHSWLPAGDLLSPDTFFLNSSPDTTLTSPGNARHPMTVIAYNQNNGSILPESSRGYTRAGLIKPDLAAPGYQLTCAVPGNLYGTATGTGASAAHAAGIMAMIFEWGIIKENYPRITGNDVTRLLIGGATRNPLYVYPNNIWGYGQINVDGLFKRLTNT